MWLSKKSLAAKQALCKCSTDKSVKLGSQRRVVNVSAFALCII